MNIKQVTSKEQIVNMQMRKTRHSYCMYIHIVHELGTIVNNRNTKKLLGK